MFGSGTSRETPHDRAGVRDGLPRCPPGGAPSPSSLCSYSLSTHLRLPLQGFVVDAIRAGTRVATAGWDASIATRPTLARSSRFCCSPARWRDAPHGGETRVLRSACTRRWRPCWLPGVHYPRSRSRTPPSTESQTEGVPTAPLRRTETLRIQVSIPGSVAVRYDSYRTCTPPIRPLPLRSSVRGLPYHRSTRRIRRALPV